MPLIWPNPDREGTGLYDGDVLTPDPDRDGVALIAGRVAGVDGTQYQSSLWSASGGRSMRVPEGDTATVTLAASSTVVGVARSAGQQFTVDGTVVTAATDGEEIRATGSSLVTFGAGWWDSLTIVAGEYTEGPFDGDTPVDSPLDPGYVSAWDGTPDASTSSQALFEETLTDEPTGAWGLDAIGVVVGVDLPLTVADGAMRLDVAVI